MFLIQCPQCRTKLIPILYGRVDYVHLDLHKQGRAFLGGMNKKPYNSYCPLCEESYEAETTIP